LHPFKRSWLTLALCSLAALAGAALSHPAEAQGSSRIFFYEGTTTGSLETPAWFAVLNRQVFGSFPEANPVRGRRLFSRRITRANYSGTVFSPSGQAEGMFSGALTHTGLAGQFSLSGAREGSYTAAPVAMSASAARAISGSYFSPEARRQGVDLVVSFNSRTGAASANATANVGFRVTLAQLSGRFGVDGSGNIWMLMTRARFARLDGVENLPLPRQNMPVKLGYRRGRNSLTLVNPFTNEVVVTLNRRR